MTQTTSGIILGVIRQESWILDHFEIFVSMSFKGQTDEQTDGWTELQWLRHAESSSCFRA